jgi:hypothetical protein
MGRLTCVYRALGHIHPERERLERDRGIDVAS